MSSQVQTQNCLSNAYSRICARAEKYLATHPDRKAQVAKYSKWTGAGALGLLAMNRFAGFAYLNPLSLGAIALSIFAYRRASLASRVQVQSPKTLSQEVTPENYLDHVEKLRSDIVDGPHREGAVIQKKYSKRMNIINDPLKEWKQSGRYAQLDETTKEKIKKANAILKAIVSVCKGAAFSTLTISEEKPKTATPKAPVKAESRAQVSATLSQAQAKKEPQKVQTQTRQPTLSQTQAASSLSVSEVAELRKTIGSLFDDMVNGIDQPEIGARYQSLTISPSIVSAPEDVLNAIFTLGNILEKKPKFDSKPTADTAAFVACHLEKAIASTPATERGKFTSLITALKSFGAGNIAFKDRYTKAMAAIDLQMPKPKVSERATDTASSSFSGMPAFSLATPLRQENKQQTANAAQTSQTRLEHLSGVFASLQRPTPSQSQPVRRDPSADATRASSSSLRTPLPSLQTPTHIPEATFGPDGRFMGFQVEDDSVSPLSLTVPRTPLLQRPDVDTRTHVPSQPSHRLQTTLGANGQFTGFQVEGGSATASSLSLSVPRPPVRMTDAETSSRRPESAKKEETPSGASAVSVNALAGSVPRPPAKRTDVDGTPGRSESAKKQGSLLEAAKRESAKLESDEIPDDDALELDVSKFLGVSGAGSQPETRLVGSQSRLDSLLEEPTSVMTQTQTQSQKQQEKAKKAEPKVEDLSLDAADFGLDDSATDIGGAAPIDDEDLDGLLEDLDDVSSKKTEASKKHSIWNWKGKA